MPKILVADDSITVRKVAERLLTEAGLEVALAASGEEALAWLANERPDFIVTDVIMPDKSGYDVCKFVRSHADLSDTPVLLISGIVNEDVTRKAESCRADGVLKKPFQGASLQERVLELLAKRKEHGASFHEQVGAGATPTPAPTVPEASDSVVTYQTSREDRPFESTSAPAASPAELSASGPKGFRITEEQLQAFRQSANRIKELEVQLADEKVRADRLSERDETNKHAERRMRELEAALADHEQRSAEARQGTQTHDELEARYKELESSWSEQRQRVSELTDHLSRLADVEQRNKELEASVEDLRAQMARSETMSLTPTHSDNGVPQLQALITDQQQRLTDLAGQVIRFSEAAAKIKELETALAHEQQRAVDAESKVGALEAALTDEHRRTADAETRINSLETTWESERNRAGEAETKVQALEAALTNEHSRAHDMEQRCADMEQAAARATMRVEDMHRLLAQIGRLTTTHEESHDRASS